MWKSKERKEERKKERALFNVADRRCKDLILDVVPGLVHTYIAREWCNSRLTRNIHEGRNYCVALELKTSHFDRKHIQYCNIYSNGWSVEYSYNVLYWQLFNSISGIGRYVHTRRPEMRLLFYTESAFQSRTYLHTYVHTSLRLILILNSFSNCIWYLYRTAVQATMFLIGKTWTIIKQ